MRGPVGGGARRKERIVVFAGPCLGEASADRWRPLVEGMDLRPPARRGDLLAALADQPRTIVLLDGYYYTVPAVTHKEILYALESGVRVIGAASMGALRAAEMAAHGMEGVGRVFRWFRDDCLDGDDEVALLHAPRELGYRPITVALVEVRYALARLHGRAGAADRGGRALVGSLKRLSFSERTPQRIADLAARHLGARSAAALERILATESVKTDDACEALRHARRPAVPAPAREPDAAGYLSSFKETYVRGPAPSPDSRAPTFLHAGQLIQLLNEDAPRFLRFLRRRFLLAAAADTAGLEVDCGTVDRLSEVLRGDHRRRLGRLVLPAVEYALEAAVHARAQAAAAGLGGGDAALAMLAQRHGVTVDAEARLLDLVAGQPDLMPPWWIARSLTFTAVLEPALAAAAIAEEVRESFRSACGERTLRHEDLLGLAGELWSVDREGVGAAGRARGLVASSSLSEGLMEALELLALGRRFGTVLGGLDSLLEELTETPLDYPLPEPGRATPAGSRPAQRIHRQEGDRQCSQHP